MDRIIYFYKASEDVAAVKTMPVLGWKLSQVGRKFASVDEDDHISEVNN